MQAAYESARTRCPGAAGLVWMAPVGHARAHASHIVQRVKSMTGKPNGGRASKGRASVRMPVLKLSMMILNMVGPFYRSFPEYERLKLLLITGKSGMMLPGTA